MQQSIFGRFINTTTCSQCRGEGRIISEPCTQCRGTAKEKQRRNLVVEIPPGIDDGNQIRLSGEGEAGSKGGPPGSLYLTLSVLPHELFTRDGDNILYELPINFAQAALGAEVEVSTLEGTTKLKIPEGSQAGKVFRFKDKGIPHLNRGGRGDQLVTLKVVTPESLSREQRELFQRLGESLGLERENLSGTGNSESRQSRKLFHKGKKKDRKG